MVMQKYAGASIAGAVKLNHGMNDVVINWSGGLHHAKKSEVSSVWGLRCCFAPGLLGYCISGLLRVQKLLF